MSRESVVKTALQEFLQQNDSGVSVSAIDDIALSYMVSVLEDLSELGSSEENLDVDQFTEMMEAYLPGFAGIKSEQVSDWMFDLASRLDNVDDQACPANPTSETPINILFSNTPPCVDEKASKDTAQQPLTSTHDIVQAEGSTDLDGNIELLQEMFPGACTIEVEHCLSVTKGDPEQAAQLILDRQDTGETLQEQTKTPRVRNKSLSELDNGKVTKQHIVDRYAYVDTDEDKKTHRPVLKTSDSKKMIRYRQGQVVSTKGERFSEVKKDMTEDMKKTYINLKPAKQYRFH